MDIRQLHYYKEIVKQGSISKAAEVLNIAQPPLSQLLKKLETELGTTLIHRYRQKWELTQSGQLLYQYAEQLLSHMDEVKRRILEIEEGTAGTVRIGVSSACSNMLIDYIADFREQYTQVKVNIVSGDSEGLLKKLKEKEIDIALLIRPSNTDQYEEKALKKQPAILIVPSKWTASLSTQPTLKEIADFPFIMLGAMEGHSFYENILNAFDEYEVKPNIMVECKDIPMVVALVNRGIGITIIPRMHYKSLFFEHLKIYELQQFDFSVEPVMMKLKDEPISKAAVQFWEMMK
ncbi:LysR family transcriptional regulator [Psychrobacillus glaciei]|uniref:LysR family transcriptional regulator n=1 Tax=Psychrobacillus glaciei TaxID=2283160 RepID=A0A5J6SL03_9BACI|nr:LysR family transcriptional regulator [Psychrobacillus glaciei]QFF98645.1 LysR family transcriptional regulator [Psychrobacillus glaciei]